MTWLKPCVSALMISSDFCSFCGNAADEFLAFLASDAIRHLPLYGSTLFLRGKDGLIVRVVDQFDIPPTACVTVSLSTEDGRNALIYEAASPGYWGNSLVAIVDWNTLDRATGRQRKTGCPAKFDIIKQTRQVVDEYLEIAGKETGDFLLSGGAGKDRSLSARQYARLSQDEP